MRAAPLHRRFLSTGVDVLLCLVPVLLLFPFVLLLPGTGAVPVSLLFGVLAASAAPAVILLYFSVRLWSASSRRESPGRRLLRLRTVYPEGRSGAIVARFVLLGALPMLAVFLLGLWPLLLLPAMLPLVGRDAVSPADHWAGIKVCSAEKEPAGQSAEK